MQSSTWDARVHSSVKEYFTRAGRERQREKGTSWSGRWDTSKMQKLTLVLLTGNS